MNSALILESLSSRLNINPQHVSYQRLTADSFSTSNARFEIYGPSERHLLLPLAFVEFTARLGLRNAADAADVNFKDTSDELGPETILAPSAVAPMQLKCCTNETITWNSQSFDVPVRDVMSSLSKLYIGRSGSRMLGNEFNNLNRLSTSANSREDNLHRFDSGWPPFANTNGNDVSFQGVASAFTSTAPTDAQMAAVFNRLSQMYSYGMNRVDNPVLFAKSSRINREFPANNNGIGAYSKDITWYEPLTCSPFNPCLLLPKSELPKCSPFRRLSPMIPYIDHLQVELKYSKPECAFDYVRHSTHSVQPSTILKCTSIQNAVLHLWWYRSPDIMSIPPSIDIPMWQVISSSKSTVTPAAGAPINVNINNFRFSSVPDLVLITYNVDKSSANYNGRSWDCAAATVGSNRDESFKLSQLRVAVGGHVNIIDATLDWNDLYNLTVKNSRYCDFPYDKFQMSEYGYGFVALTPTDIASEFPESVNSGSFMDVTLIGTNNTYRGNITYACQIHFIYNNLAARVSAHKCQSITKGFSVSDVQSIQTPSRPLEPISQTVGGTIRSNYRSKSMFSK